jgi:hypothetical protein
MPYGRGLDDVAVGRTVNSDGGGVRGTYCGRIVSGCRGLQPSDFVSHTFPDGIDPVRRLATRGDLQSKRGNILREYESE